VVLPVPAGTEPVADAYLHIAALADAIAARVGSRTVAYWQGTVTTDGNGDFTLPGTDGVLSNCTGAVLCDAGAAPAPHLFRLILGGPPGAARVRTHTYTGGGFGAATFGVAVIAWGVPA